MHKLLLLTIAVSTVAVSTSAEARGLFRWGSRHSFEYSYVQPHFKRADFYKVLDYCRRKYPWSSDVNAQFTGMYGQHGWFCAYRQ